MKQQIGFYHSLGPLWQLCCLRRSASPAENVALSSSTCGREGRAMFLFQHAVVRSFRTGVGNPPRAISSSTSLSVTTPARFAPVGYDVPILRSPIRTVLRLSGMMNHSNRTSPPQELEIRSPDNERFTKVVKDIRSTESKHQFLLSLPRAQRGWSANQALQRLRSQ